MVINSRRPGRRYLGIGWLTLSREPQTEGRKVAGPAGNSKDRRSLWESNGRENTQQQSREGDSNRLAALSDREMLRLQMPQYRLSTGSQQMSGDRWLADSGPDRDFRLRN